MQGGGRRPPEGLALIFATIGRPHMAQRLISSVRRHFPQMPVYVADQSEPEAEQAAFYEANGCTVAWLEHDAGVCAARNALLDLVREPYFVLCDDDFVLGPQTDFTPALTVLEHSPGTGVVGGRLFDVIDEPQGRRVQKRFWELLFHYDRDKGKLLTIPLHYFAPEPRDIGGVRCYDCDAVMNFAVFRTAMFDGQIRWDPQFKSNGEHEDFYLNLKVHGQHGVVYTPDLAAYHNPPPLVHESAYGRMRIRTRGWQMFLQKWGLRQFLELDEGLRLANMVDGLQPYAMGYEAFYRAAPMAPERAPVPAGCLQVSSLTGQAVPQGAWLEECPPEAPPVAARVGVSLDGTVTGVSGAWPAAAPAPVPVPAAPPAPAAGSRPRPEFEVSWPQAEAAGRDLFCYLRPGAGADGPGCLAAAEVVYSVAAGADYLVYRKPALAFGQELRTGQWNAVALPVPLLAAELRIEITVVRGGELLFECARALSLG
ncbi:MAG: glycosyltransferase [Rhodobacteraceae bacterium]|nr:glycosyltransferase [Paracoccaceae bacterium]